MQAYVLASLAAATKEFNGDLKRTYLTGASMRGYGTWAFAEKYSGKFAAIVPICGGIAISKGFLEKHPERANAYHPDDPKSYAQVAARIGKTPVWIFHAADDPIAPVEDSRRMNEALKAVGGNVRYTEYPGVGHDSAGKAYAEPELMTWLLSKSL